ncbi:MAG: MOSC domain-containing protein [Clostridiales bacterium]|jgi:molybdenum cofactor synthesis domain-containing protein|nr:MOSC domain-containing protein [Clostridiales bacterium]
MAGETGIVKAVCVSETRGVQKGNVNSARLKIGWGVENDAHGGDWHRQVSLLSYDSIRRFNELGAGVDHGDFGENLVVEGIDFRGLPVGTVLKCGDCLLEITQIGKECHTHCQIYRKMGDCIMPREGVFARVLKEGDVSAGDIMKIVEQADRRFRAAVVTLSDKGSREEREDQSGPLIARILEEAGYRVEARVLLPDERKQIETELINLADRRRVDLVLTTGGTGFSRRDVTPEATIAVAERMAPGVAEAIRANSLRITGRAMLSRGVSAIRGGTLIVNLPGSPKAVRESLEYVLPHLAHGLEILRGDASECGGR